MVFFIIKRDEGFWKCHHFSIAGVIQTGQRSAELMAKQNANDLVICYWRQKRCIDYAYRGRF